MSEEQVESIFQHACEGAAESIGSTRVDWQRVVDAIRFLRRELEASESLRSATISTMRRNEAELTEARRLLDDARAQKPVGFRYRIGGPTVEWRYAPGDATLTRSAIVESEPLYAAAPVPAQPAAVPADVMAALDRMCTPLDDSWLGSQSATAKSDAHSMKVIRDYVLGSAVKESLTTEQPAAVPEAVAKDCAGCSAGMPFFLGSHYDSNGYRIMACTSPTEDALLSAADTEVKK